MHDQRTFIEQLRQCDQAYAGPTVSVDPSRCRRMAARKRATRVQAAGTLGLTLLTAGAWWILVGNDSAELLSRRLKSPPVDTSPVHPPSRIDPTVDPVEPPVQTVVPSISDVQREINDLEQTLARYQTRQRLATLQTRLAVLAVQPMEAEMLLNEGTNTTAAVALDYAHRLAHELNEPLSATAEYRRVVKHYPDTQWAVAAAHALAGQP